MQKSMAKMFVSLLVRTNYSQLGDVTSPAHFYTTKTGCATGCQKAPESSGCHERVTAGVSAGLVQRISTAALITHDSDPVSLQQMKETSAGGPEFSFSAAFLWNP